MNINPPVSNQIPQLKALWQQAFGDTDAEIDAFFNTGFSYKRCLCVTCGEDVAAALYWFDCSVWDHKVAYLYAIATKKEFQHQGIASKLIAHTHEVLKSTGYAGAILVPSEGDLFAFYRRFGYTAFGGIAEAVYHAAKAPTFLSKIDKSDYITLRKAYLPQGGILQEDSLLDCLDAFYQGEDFICVAYPRSGALFVPELLGNIEKAPGILAAFGLEKGTFRTPGEHPFAMVCPFGGLPTPTYFGLALD